MYVDILIRLVHVYNDKVTNLESKQFKAKEKPNEQTHKQSNISLQLSVSELTWGQVLNSVYSHTS